MLVVGIILIVLVLLAFLRIGVTAEYSEEGFKVLARIGPIRYPVYPPQEKGKKKEKKKKTKEKQEQKGGKLATFQEFLPSIAEAVGRLRRKLTINDLRIYYMAAGSDPSKTAMSFGIASAGLGVLVPVLENLFRIKSRDLRTSVSFTESEPYVYLMAKLSLALWEIIYIAWSPLMAIVKANTKTKNRKVDAKHGQASDKRLDGNDHAENQGDG